MAITLESIKEMQGKLVALMSQTMDAADIKLREEKETDETKKRLVDPNTFDKDPSKHYRPIYNAQQALDTLSARLVDKEGNENTNALTNDSSLITYINSVVAPAIEQAVYQTKTEKNKRDVLKVELNKDKTPFFRQSTKGDATTRSGILNSLKTFLDELRSVVSAYNANANHPPVTNVTSKTTPVSSKNGTENREEPSVSQSSNGVSVASDEAIIADKIATAVNTAKSEASKKATELLKNQREELEKQQAEAIKKAVLEAQAALEAKHNEAVKDAVEQAKKDKDSEFEIKLHSVENAKEAELEEAVKKAKEEAMSAENIKALNDQIKELNGQVESQKTQHELDKVNSEKFKSLHENLVKDVEKAVGEANTSIKLLTPKTQKPVEVKTINDGIAQLASMAGALALANANLITKHAEEMKALKEAHAAQVQQLTAEKDNAVSRLRMMISVASDFIKRIGHSISSWSFADTLHAFVVSGTTTGAGLLLGLGIVLSGNPFTAPIGFGLLGMGVLGLMMTAYKALTSTSGTSSSQALQRLKDVTKDSEKSLSSTAGLNNHFSLNNSNTSSAPANDGKNVIPYPSKAGQSKSLETKSDNSAANDSRPGNRK